MYFLFIDIKANSLDIPVKITGEKRKPSEDVLSFGAKRQVTNGIKSEEVSSSRNVNYVLPIWIDTKQPVNLGVPSVQDKLVKTVIINAENHEEVILEAINYAGGISKIQCRSGDNTLWSDKLQTEVIHLGGSVKFYVASTADGRLYTYTPAGRRFYPAIILDSVLSILECSGDYLLYITAVGRLDVM